MPAGASTEECSRAEFDPDATNDGPRAEEWPARSRRTDAETLLTNQARQGAGVFRVRQDQTSSNGVTMAEGTIKRLTDKGFGFIDMGTGKDLFFHMSALQGVRFDDLREGQRVQFTEGRGPKGPNAENVRPV